MFKSKCLLSSKKNAIMKKKKIVDPKIIFRELLFKKEGKQVLKNIKKNLIKEGYLDSMDVVNLASLIQKTFKKNRSFKRKILKSFEKFDLIIKLIK